MRPEPHELSFHYTPALSKNPAATPRCQSKAADSENGRFSPCAKGVAEAGRHATAGERACPTHPSRRRRTPYPPGAGCAAQLHQLPRRIFSPGTFQTGLQRGKSRRAAEPPSRRATGHRPLGTGHRAHRPRLNARHGIRAHGPLCLARIQAQERVYDAALPRWGKGRCGSAWATLFAPLGQRRCCVARLILAGLRGKACCGAVCLSGRAGRRAGRAGVGERSRQGMDIHVLRQVRCLMGENAPFSDRMFSIARARRRPSCSPSRDRHIPPPSRGETGGLCPHPPKGPG